VQAGVREHRGRGGHRAGAAGGPEGTGEPHGLARAAFVRRQCRPADRPTGDPRRAGGQRRQDELRGRHEAAWLGPLRKRGAPHISSLITSIAVALIFGLINATLKPLIKVIGCAFYVLTLGLAAMRYPAFRSGSSAVIFGCVPANTSGGSPLLHDSRNSSTAASACARRRPQPSRWL